ncbi:MAG TPA: type IV pilus assembly protein PilM [Solirubrobacteraceae bacterium]
MAKRSSTLTGLEIEPSAVYVASIAPGTQISVQEAALAPLEPGVVRDGEVQDPDALADVLRRLFEDHRNLDKRVRIGIANQKIVVRMLEMPPIEDAKELASAVRFAAQDELPMPLDAAVLDHQILDIVETPQGLRQRVLVVAARRDMIERVLTAVRGAGLKPEGIDLAAFGMVRALHAQSDPRETVVYLAIGGLTNLAVARGTACHFTRVINDGIDDLAVELSERRGMTLEGARAWLENVGLELPVEEHERYAAEGDLLEDARAVLADGVRRIAGEVRNTVDFHHAQGFGEGVARCVITGPAAAIRGFAAAMQAELSLPVEVGVVQVPPGMDGGSLSVAAGLATEVAA